MSDSLWKTDCRHFVGEKPCVFRRECDGCPEYDPVKTRILALKIGALGDVLRTTPVLEALSEKYEGLHVTWVVGDGARPLLEGHPGISRLLTPGYETSEVLGVESFDLVLSLDKDPYSTALAMRVASPRKLGFGRSSTGALVPLSASAQYAYDLGLSDDLKFHRNEKTYQEIIFDVCELSWRHYEYSVPACKVGEDARAVLESSALGGDGPLVGFNTGAGGVFANKAWTIDGYVELARRLAKAGCRVALLGGESERSRNRTIEERAAGAARDTGAGHTLPAFAELVSACDLVVTGDTLGMHLAIAGRVPVVVLFGSTCAQEIELYGRGEKIVTSIDCHPCYLRSCDISPSCQDVISVDQVFEAAQRVLANSR